MKKLHLYAGIFGLAAFAATGQYMDIVHNHLVGMDDFLRMKYRSVHIYLLFSALLNMVLSLYWQKLSGRRLARLQSLSSIIFAVLPFVFLISFFRDIPFDGIERPIARIGIYMAVAATMLAALASYSKHIFGEDNKTN